MIELVSTFFLPVNGRLTSLQLYCACGNELDGERESYINFFGELESRIYLECDECGFCATGRDAECIVSAAVEGII